MAATNTVAEGLEKLGVRTFSAKEMAFNILGREFSFFNAS